MAKRGVPMVVACAGVCGKTQRVRSSRMLAADVYVCGAPECEKKALPVHLPGTILVRHLNAAGGFYGFTFERPTEEHLQAVERARLILQTGLATLRGE